MKNKFRAGQYVICKYNGDNGDLIVGKIVSVRRGGDAVLTNLLTHVSAVKKTEVLESRNTVVPKKVADSVVLYSQGKSRKQTREFAVNLQRMRPLLKDDSWYRAKARDDHELPGEVEFDDGCKVSRNDRDGEPADGGAWVQAWIWVGDE